MLVRLYLSNGCPLRASSVSFKCHLVVLLCSWYSTEAAERRGLPLEVRRAVAAVSKALRAACEMHSGGTAAAGQLEAEAAADAAADALLQV